MLSADLSAAAGLDLGSVSDLVTGLGEVMAQADLPAPVVDLSQVTQLASTIAVPDLSGVGGSLTALTASLGLGLDSTGLHVEDVGRRIEDLHGVLEVLGHPLGLPTLSGPDLEDGGLDGLAVRMREVQEQLGTGALPALLGLVPGVDVAGTVPRIGGAVGGIVALLQSLAGLAATSAISSRTEHRSRVIVTVLAPEALRSAAEELARWSADIGLPARIRAMDPHDVRSVALVQEALVAGTSAATTMALTWSRGMAFGEATLGALDLTGAHLGLDAARLALATADRQTVASLSETVLSLLRPVLALPVPDAAGWAQDAVSDGLLLVNSWAAVLDAVDADLVTAPIAALVSALTSPLRDLGSLIEDVTGAVSGALRSIREALDGFDLSVIADAVAVALRPVSEVLNGIESAIGGIESSLADAAQAITSVMSEIAEAVDTLADTVASALASVRELLATVDLAGLARRLEDALGTVANALASASLTPYFDSAIDVVDTAAGVVDAVPFTMLPTEVQQGVVDACRPIKELDLEPLSQELHTELSAIQDSFSTAALEGLSEAYDAVHQVLIDLDPEPALIDLESGPMSHLRDAVAGIDPGALLAPVEEALAPLREGLSGFSLDDEVLLPLDAVLAPVRQTLLDLNPAAVLTPVAEALAQVRAAAAALLHLDDLDAGLDEVHALVVTAVAKVDITDVAAALDASVHADASTALSAVIALPDRSPLPALIATLGRLSGLDSAESGVAEALRWSTPRPTADLADANAVAAVVRARLTQTETSIAQAADAVRALDPTAYAAAAAAQNRAIQAAITSHPSDSLLRIELTGSTIGGLDALASLADNRRRYLSALDAAAREAHDLAGDGRSDLAAATAELRLALNPLAVVVDHIRNLLQALGLAPAGDESRPLGERLLATFGPDRVLPAVVDLVRAARTTALRIINASLDPLHGAVGEVRTLLDTLSLDAVEAELRGLHDDVLAQFDAVDPRTLLGPTIADADAVIQRVATFDPLAAVREVVDAAREAADAVLDSARPTVVFADAIGLHGDLLTMAEGLDVARLLEPIISTLNGFTGQLDDGFTRSIDSLQRLQSALPDEVGAGPSVDLGIDVGVSL